MRLFVSSFLLTISLIAASFTGTARSATPGGDTSRSDKTDSTSDSDPDPICDTCWMTTGNWPDTAGTVSITDVRGVNTNTDTSGTSLDPHRPPQMRWQHTATRKVFVIKPLSTPMSSTADRFSTRSISMRDFLEIKNPITLNTETASITSYIETGSDIEAATTDTSGT
jgi:hypothetical protein